MERRKVLTRVIETIRLIGKRGLSYRGKGNKAAYSLGDKDVDHGNFLEILLLVAEFDPPLKTHLDKVIQESERRRRKLEQEGDGTKKGRGAVVSLISKTTVNQIVSIIAKMIKEEISKDVQEAGMFSVQLDTTQDISVNDQCSIILRYVTDKVHERLVAVKNCTSSTGKAICELLSGGLQDLRIDVKTCVGSSTDGASNMQGEYEGFQAHLSKLAPLKVHVWCYSHVLNLVITSTTETNVESISLFGLLNAIANFVRESYLRMDIFRESRSTFQSAEEVPKVNKSLVSFGKTRFWSKEKGLKNLFGDFGDPSSSLYVPVLLALDEISSNSKFNSDVRYQASTLKESLMDFKTVLTAHVYLRLFSKTSRLSTYLQTSGMDILQAQRMVATTTESLKKIQRDFEEVLTKSEEFTSWANGKLEAMDSEMVVERELRTPRIRKKKRMPGELAEDTRIQDPLERFKVEVHNVILDKCVNTLETRFLAHGNLAADLACLDPTNFPDILQAGLPDDALLKLCKIMSKFCQVTATELKGELLHFAANWEKFKLSVSKEYEVEILDSGEETNSEDDLDITKETDGSEGTFQAEPADEDIVGSGAKESDHNQEEANKRRKKRGATKKESCKACANCCYLGLKQYVLNRKTYEKLFLAYKVLLTLSCTQIQCERCFSKLKFIKNRLRSTLTQGRLECFMLMAVERTILNRLSNDAIIDALASKSKLLTSLLCTD